MFYSLLQSLNSCSDPHCGVTTILLTRHKLNLILSHLGLHYTLTVPEVCVQWCLLSHCSVYQNAAGNHKVTACTERGRVVDRGWARRQNTHQSGRPWVERLTSAQPLPSPQLPPGNEPGHFHLVNHRHRPWWFPALPPMFLFSCSCFWPCCLYLPLSHPPQNYSVDLKPRTCFWTWFLLHLHLQLVLPRPWVNSRVKYLWFNMWITDRSTGLISEVSHSSLCSFMLIPMWKTWQVKFIHIGWNFFFKLMDSTALTWK